MTETQECKAYQYQGAHHCAPCITRVTNLYEILRIFDYLKWIMVTYQLLLLPISGWHYFVGLH